MIVLGLTGSIGMGKSTIASMLRHLGVPVHDADASVHDLMRHDKAVRGAIASTFPIYRYPALYHKKDKSINRVQLGKLVFEHDEKRRALENILHPAVRQAQTEFIRQKRSKGIKIVALDIPLLFETGADMRVDYTLTASAPYAIQRSRVLSRPNMNEAKFHAIVQKQMPDGEKRLRADYVIDTGIGRARTMGQLKKMLQDLKGQNKSTFAQDKEKPLSYYLYG